RDMSNHPWWDFEPSSASLSKLADTLKRWTNCDVELDAAAVKVSGLTFDGPLPGALMGGVTLRSVEELLLAPHGLGLAASADGKKLVITKRMQVKETESYFQKLHAKQLSERLDRAATDV